MRWLKIPIEELKFFDPNYMDRRTNVEGTEALLHEELYNELVTPTMTLEETGETKEIAYPFPILDNEEVEELLKGSDWTNEE